MAALRLLRHNIVILICYFYGGLSGLQEEKESHPDFGRAGDAKGGSSWQGRGTYFLSLGNASIRLLLHSLFQTVHAAPAPRSWLHLPSIKAAALSPMRRNAQQLAARAQSPKGKNPLHPSAKTRRTSYDCFGTIERGSVNAC